MKEQTKAAALHFLGLASLILSTDDTEAALNIKAGVDTTRDLIENYDRLILLRDEERAKRIADMTRTDEPLKEAAPAIDGVAQG